MLEPPRGFSFSRENVILLVVGLWPLIVLSYLDASLGLVAFSILMWATLPWAYLKQVDDSVNAEIRMLDAQKEPEEEYTFANRPYWWIRTGTRMFFFAGVCYLAQAMVSLASQANPTLIPDEAYGLFFWGGSVLLIWAMFDSYRVIEYVMSRKIPTYTGRMIATLAIWVVVISALETVQLFVLVGIVPNLQAFGPAGYVYAATGVLSFAGLFFAAITFSSEWTNLKKLAYLLLALPWVVLVLWVFGFI